MHTYVRVCYDVNLKRQQKFGHQILCYTDTSAASGHISCLHFPHLSEITWAKTEARPTLKTCSQPITYVLFR